MKEFKLIISTPDGNKFDDNVVAFFARGTEGDFAILANHAPFVTAVVECDVRFEKEDGTEYVGHCEGGIVTVKKEETTLLSGSFNWITK